MELKEEWSGLVMYTRRAYRIQYMELKAYPPRCSTYTPWQTVGIQYMELKGGAKGNTIGKLRKR